MLGYNRITFDQSIMGGQACIRGMRITVSLLVGLVARGKSFTDIIKNIPIWKWKTFNRL